MKYQITLFSGEAILLTDEQYAVIRDAWDKGVQEFYVGGQRISRKGIASIGYTSGAILQKKVEETAHFHSLSYEEQKALKDKQFQMAKMAAGKKKVQMIQAGAEEHERVWKSIGGKEIKVLMDERKEVATGMTAEESERGDAEYWVNENGEKMYS